MEESFIKNFISKKYRDRFLYESTSAKKRNKFLNRFAHVNEPIFVEAFIIKQGKFSDEEGEATIQNYCSMREMAYIIGTEYDKMKMPILEALKICRKSYEPVILICSEKLIYIKTETDFGSAYKYVLLKK